MDYRTHLGHLCCCKLLIGGPILTAVGIYLLVIGSSHHRQQQIAQLNSYADTWSTDPDYGFQGFKQELAFARTSVVQDAGSISNCAALAPVLHYYSSLQGGDAPADTLVDAPDGLMVCAHTLPSTRDSADLFAVLPEACLTGHVRMHSGDQSWQQWKLTSAWPPANASLSAAFVQGCALRLDLLNGAVASPGSLIATTTSALVTHTAYSELDLQCGPYTQCSSFPSSSTTSSSSSLLAVSSVGTSGSSVGLTAARHGSQGANSCPTVACQSACAAKTGAWDAAAGTCIIQTGLRALCLRATPHAASQPLVYSENNTAPAPATGPGCFLRGGQFQPAQQGIITPGAGNWSVSVMLRSSQDPYLSYLVLTNGGAFAMDTQAFTITGAVLLAVGLFSMATLFLTVCLCCICIRRVLRRNNGQGLSYTQNAAYTIAQMYRLPLGPASTQYRPPASMQYPINYPVEQQMVNAPYGYQQQPPYNQGYPPQQPQGYGYTNQTGPQDHGYAPQYQQQQPEYSREQQQQYPPPYAEPVTGYPDPRQQQFPPS